MFDLYNVYTDSKTYDGERKSILVKMWNVKGANYATYVFHEQAELVDVTELL